ncbi:MAG: ABC transporter ATP-binding protein [Candidatus Bathyarchaeota archaeon]|nr:ABC transporter ATP-binding protein [Candidatus Bathyarchaeota archaeon]
MDSGSGPVSLMPVIEVKDLYKSFGSVKVLEDVSFNVEKGEFYGLFGPNGAGKTTLLRIITGQLEADSGTAVTLGVSATDPIEVKRSVGIVPEAETPPTFLTTRESLELACRIRCLDDIKVKVDHWLRFFDIEDKADVLCRDISKGQRQKVMLASAFIHEPEVLLVDEPFINLDPIYQRKVREYFMDLIEEGRTVFMCTHILEIAEKLCSRIAVIHEGRIIQQGSIEELRRDQEENLEDIFIRVVEGVQTPAA